MLLRRLIAVLVAVGLVVGAVQIRARLFPEGARAGSANDNDARVVCVQELARACEAAQTDGPAPVIEDAATTVARFAQTDPGVDVWVAVDPWPELAADARAASGLAALDAASSDVIARSPVVLAARDDRLEALEPTCGGELTWRCIGDQSGEAWDGLGGPSAWGDVEVGFNRPEQTTEGLLTLAQATSSYFDGGGFSSRSLAAPDYFAWLSDLAREAGRTGGQTPLERMLLTGGADVEFTGVLEGTALPLLAAAQQRAERIRLRALAPAVTADVRVTGYGQVGQRVAPEVADRLTEPLADNGWRVAGAPPSTELVDIVLPDDNGLPSAAALERLRQTWSEVAQ